jgi:hypothetical protein
VLFTQHAEHRIGFGGAAMANDKSSKRQSWKPLPQWMSPSPEELTRLFSQLREMHPWLATLPISRRHLNIAVRAIHVAITQRIPQVYRIPHRVENMDAPLTSRERLPRGLKLDRDFLGIRVMVNDDEDGWELVDLVKGEINLPSNGSYPFRIWRESVEKWFLKYMSRWLPQPTVPQNTRPSDGGFEIELRGRAIPTTTLEPAAQRQSNSAAPEQPEKSLLDKRIRDFTARYAKLPSKRERDAMEQTGQWQETKAEKKRSPQALWESRRLAAAKAELEPMGLQISREILRRADRENAANSHLKSSP